MICIPTISSILSDDSRDVIAEIIPNSEYEYLKKREIMLSYYSYRGIGNCDVDYWVNCMKQKYAFIKDEYDIKIKAFLNLKNKENIDLNSDKLTQHNEYTFEDTPSQQITNQLYLSTRNKNDFTQQRQSDNDAVATVNYIDFVKNPFNDFALEFKELFYFGV